MRKLQKGFTLIELMIVVAIIGILAAVAIPSYQDYTARAQVTEAMSLTSGMKTALAEHYADKGRFPGSPVSISATTAGKYVTTITWTAPAAGVGTILVIATMKGVDINANIQNSIFDLETEDGGNTWACGTLVSTASAGALDSRFLPGACK